jgi:hypothetical protein
MKRLMFLGIITCVGLLLAPAAVADNPQGPPGGLGVEIVNPLPVPVTVKGDANITGDVNVVNQPAVDAVQSGDWIVTVENSTSVPVSILLSRVTSTGKEKKYTVPEGMRLNIKHVSWVVTKKFGEIANDIIARLLVNQVGPPYYGPGTDFAFFAPLHGPYNDVPAAGTWFVYSAKVDLTVEEFDELSVWGHGRDISVTQLSIHGLLEPMQ